MTFENDVEFTSLDGFELKGTVRKPQNNAKVAVLLVHGITVDREEDGFYTELAKRMDSLEAMSLRFDLRGHGKSEGKFEEVTLNGIINDICSAFMELETLAPHVSKAIIGTSFGGGLSAYWTSENPNKINSLVLLNPLLDYGKRMLFSKPYWDGNKLTMDGSLILRKQGWLPHGEFRMGRGLINELLHLRPYERMSNLVLPILTIHGDKDSMVPFDIAKKYTNPNTSCSFIQIEGADHGFTSPDDEDFQHPDTIRFRNIVFEKVIKWIRDNT